MSGVDGRCEKWSSQKKICVIPEEAAELCSTSYEAIQEWIRDDPNFPAIGIGRKTIIPVAGLRAYIEAKAKLRPGLKTHSSAVADIVMRKRRERA